jgi:hypothetical protein
MGRSTSNSWEGGRVPIFDLNSPTGLALQWGWLLVTRTNAIVYILLVVVFVLGITVRLPGGRRESATAGDVVADPRPTAPAGGAGS